MLAPSTHHASDRGSVQDGAPGPELSDRSLAALDLLADVLVHRMARTPEGIARTLDEVMHAPVADLRVALACVDQHLQRRSSRTDSTP